MIRFRALRAFFIHALGIPRFANLKRRIHENLDKIPDGPAQLLAMPPVRGNERSDHADSVAAQKFGYESDPSDILVPMFFRKTEIAA